MGGIKMKIHEINKELENCIDYETGEVDYERLKSLQMEKGAKLENIALWIKNLIAEKDAIKNEMKALAERAEAKEKKAEQLKAFLNYALEGQKFETAKVAISYRKSVSVNLVNEEAITDNRFIRIVENRSIDKIALKEALKSGEKVEGAELVEKQNIQIK